MGIPMLKIRRPVGRLIFNMGNAIPSKTVFLIETAPWFIIIWEQNWVKFESKYKNGDTCGDHFASVLKYKYI